MPAWVLSEQIRLTLVWKAPDLDVIDEHIVLVERVRYQGAIVLDFYDSGIRVNGTEVLDTDEQEKLCRMADPLLMDPNLIVGRSCITEPESRNT